MAINNAGEPLVFSLTQNTWVKILEANKARTSLAISNESTTSGETARVQFPKGNNPFAYDFVTNTDIAITPVLTAPNTWASVTEGSIIIKFKADAHAGTRTLVSFGDTNANELLSVYIDDDEKIGATCIDGGTTQWTMNTDNSISTDKWYVLELKVFKENNNSTISPIIIINGEEWASTFIVSTDKTVFMSGLSGIDNGFIGCSNYNSAGKANYFEGEIDYVKLIDRSTTKDRATQVAQYRLEAGAGTTATDSWQHGDNGTITAGGGGWVARSTGQQLDKEQSNIYTIKDGDEFITRALWGYTTVSSLSLTVLEATNDSATER